MRALSAIPVKTLIPSSQRSPLYEAVKRFCDILTALVLLVVLSPIMLAAAVLIKLTSRGPILFLQWRVGRYDRPFRIIKFRTMLCDAEAAGPQITSADDNRITRVGRFMRTTKIDEFPQLFNVLMGHMSFVGPRPQVPRFVEKFPQELRETVLAVRPGITGPTQIEYRHEEDLLEGVADREAFYIRELLPDKCRMDAEYVRRRSLVYDAAIICETALIFLRGNAKRIARRVRPAAPPMRAVSLTARKREDEKVDVAV
jgi:lipopolysaccharide/colanic/teichoic acid biosynthesis glycosyltransferase